ncbi:MAG: hypothetical protein JJE25_04930 [Bacteroidia bacterium]|nr:hypothetical protein [Bacteroidia bacterium]
MKGGKLAYASILCAKLAQRGKNSEASQNAIAPKDIADLKRDPPKAGRFGNAEEREWVFGGD